MLDSGAMGQAEDTSDITWVQEETLKVPLHAQVGLRVEQLGPHAVLTMELGDSVRGAVEGSVHGGILATFADIACATAVWGAHERGTEVPVTTDLHMRYYRQPRRGPLTARADLVHRGRRLLSCECVVEDAEGRALARATATYMIVPYVPS